MTSVRGEENGRKKLRSRVNLRDENTIFMKITREKFKIIGHRVSSENLITRKYKVAKKKTKRHECGSEQFWRP